MGYTTEFEGRIQIVPAVSEELEAKINEFCQERHGGNISRDTRYPGFWCDYVVGGRGTWISWNGNEKSYEMEEWLALLIEKFFKPAGHVLNGTMKAQGESMSDRYRIVVKDNVVQKKAGHGEVDQTETARLDELTRDLTVHGLDEEDAEEIALNLLRKYTMVRK